MRSSVAAFLAMWALSVSAAWGGPSAFMVEPVGGAQGNPRVGGSVVVWMQIFDGDWTVRGKDLATGTAFAIDEPNATELDPITDGRLVVWRDNRGEGSGYDLFALDLHTGQQRAVVDEPHSQVQHALGQNLLAWNDARNSPSHVPPEYGNHDIYALDLVTGEEFPVCTALWDQEDPAIDGNIIVWADYRRANPILNPLISDIYGYDVTTGREFLIASADDDVRQVKPDISGRIVVWADMHNGGDIWGHDLHANTTFPICVNPFSQNDVAIDGRYVVWEDYRNGVDQDIWGYDLLTGREFPIYLGPGDQGDPSISGDLVVWDSYTPGEDARIWGAYIPEPVTVLLLLTAAPLVLRRRTG